ncbi:MAG: FeoB-associated Cys-rich membrane protein [Thermodesulfobacteriota bacterium]|nr:FeoB-associated Cys-rich membrane protein [Thermodesulfobacteriota bacterium]
MIIAAAAFYVVHSMYKTIKEASTGGCGGGCSACSHCKFAPQTLKKNAPSR